MFGFPTLPGVPASEIPRLRAGILALAGLGPCKTCGAPYAECEISADDPDYSTDENGNHDGLCCEECQHHAAEHARSQPRGGVQSWCVGLVAYLEVRRVVVARVTVEAVGLPGNSLPSPSSRSVVALKQPSDERGHMPLAYTLLGFIPDAGRDAHGVSGCLSGCWPAHTSSLVHVMQKGKQNPLCTPSRRVVSVMQ